MIELDPDRDPDPVRTPTTPTPTPTRSRPDRDPDPDNRDPRPDASALFSEIIGNLDHRWVSRELDHIGTGQGQQDGRLQQVRELRSVVPG